MTIRKYSRFLFIFLFLWMTSCSLPFLPSGDSTGSPPPPLPPAGEDTPTIQPPATATLTATMQPATLTLDGAYFCRRGPGTNYLDVVDYPSGTVLPIIGSSAGWWLVAIEDHRTHHTECWIGGGVTSGDMGTVPVLPAPAGFVPVHDESNWSSLIYLDCSELDEYRWIWNETSSGEYVATTPILGVARPTIVYDQWIGVCPGWFPPEVVRVRDEATWQVIGYLTCTELELYTWTWNGASSGEYVASATIFGSDRPTIYMGDVTPHCPLFSP